MYPIVQMFSTQGDSDFREDLVMSGDISGGFPDC